MERNEALLRKVGDVIANEPERYDQRVHIESRTCGTVACIAGHAHMLTGNRPFETDGPWADELLGLASHELRIFDPRWKPAGDPSVPLHERVQAALYALAEGASVEEVTAGTGTPDA